MEQIKYQGYARDRGFNPIQLSTASVDAIAQQGNFVLRQMRDNADTERRNRDQYLSGMERAQGIEAQNRSENFQFTQNAQRSYQDAVLRNKQTEINNIKTESDQQLRAFESLAGLSKTISEAVIARKKKQDEIAELETSNLIFTTGITYKEYQALQASEGKLDAADTQINSVVNKLKAAGYSEEYLSKLRGLSGARLYGASKQWAIQGGENYASFRAQMADVPFEVGGRQITLAQASDGSPEEYETLNTLVRSEYLKQYRGLNQAFADKYLYSKMRETETRERLMFSEKRGKQLELDRTQQETNTLLTAWDTEKGAGVLKWIQTMAGGDPKELGEKRRLALSYLVNAAKVGKFTGDGLIELENTQFLLNGSTTPTTFGKQYDLDLGELRSAVRSFNQQQRQDREQAEDDQKKQYERDLNALAAQRPLNKAEVRKAINDWRSAGWGDPPGWLKSMETQEQLDDDAGDAILRNLKVQGTLTRKELFSGRYSDVLIDRYDDFVKAQEQVPQAEQKIIFDAVNAALKGSLQSIGAGTNQNSDYFIAQGEARRIVTQRAAELIAGGASPPIKAWEQARDEVIQEIRSGANPKKPEGRFRLRTLPSGEADLTNKGFALATGITSTKADQQRVERIRARINATKDTTFLGKEKLLTDPEIQQLQAFRSGGGNVPTIVWSIAAGLPGASPFDVADLMLNAYNLPPIQRPPAAEIYDSVRPELMHLMTRYQSMDRAMRALEGSGAPYKPILNLIASRESSNDTQFGGYDSMNRGEGRPGTGSQVLGRPLTQMTVAEVLNLGASDKIYAAGRYQFIPSTLRSLVNRGVVDRNSLFDEATQDQLAITYLRDRTGKFWSGEASAGSYVPGLGNAWHGLRSVRPEQIVQAMEYAKQNLAGGNVDVSRMRPQVVYRVGGIGPQGARQYGAHLDIKRTDGKFFQRTALDNYLSFKTGQGLIPLSKGVTVEGGEFGASRWYGSHNGWDYAIAEGTPVVLKNGARVISKRPSEYGDVLTIATPDGRRFNIIHGKAT